MRKPVCLRGTITEHNPSKSGGRRLPLGPCPASETVWRVIEPMLEASAEKDSSQIGSGLHGRKANGAPLSANISESRDAPLWGVSACGLVCDGHAPESIRGRVGSCSGRRNINETWELFCDFFARRATERKMAKATGERRRRGRSLRSSLRTGKPSTWRREAVDTDCQQEVD